ncbi:putative transposase [Sinorhizobium fredii]|uniref:Mu transposase C-terminal domain-containing protein n=1 Tax=Sinorhizobium sp. CCBAU 05631 TaxID=794846 RepID=UPI0004B34954|nr:Mu transposase C-terminal domain-containing protein [Sinorhizobium sp. CCBAU 05631]ASY56589.1 TniA putative transposase [Sinorhizobium sp. CCBAU 05631]
MSETPIPFTTFGFDETDRVRIRGTYYRVRKRDDGLGYIFTEIGGRGEVLAPVHFEISRMVQSRALKVERKWFAREDALAKAGPPMDPGDLPDYAASRFLMVTKFLEGRREGIWPKSEEGVQKFYANYDKIRAAFAPKPRGGKKIDTSDGLTRVCPRQFLRNVAKFEASGRNPFSLVRNYRGRSLHPSQFDESVVEAAEEYIGKIPNAKRPKVRKYYDDFIEGSRIAGLSKEEVPSYRTFLRWRHDILEDLHIAAAYSGEDAAKDDFQMTGAGQRRYKPLERVEFDEHKLDLMSLLKGTRLWGVLHDEAQKKIDAMRFWCSVAIDVGTRSILAMRLLDSDPGGRSGIETLRMACSPKEGTALFAGSEAPWPMSGKPGTVATDSGAAYNQRDFQLTVVSLCGTHLIPPVRNARLRGVIERYFRTFNDRYMHLFSGRTFSNPITRGAYDSKANASMNFEEFARHLVRLIVDAYHHTPHAGLDGQTPIDAWTTMTAKYEVLSMTEKDERAFDITIYDHPVGRNGLIFLGIPYVDERLQKFRSKNKKGRVDLRVNLWDLSRIRVRTLDGKGFYPLRTPIPGFEGVSVTHWRIALRWLEERFSIDEQKNYENVRRAIKATEYAVEVAEEKNDISSHLITKDDLLEVHRSIKGHIFQPKASQDYGDILPEEVAGGDPSATPPEPRRSRRDIVGPSSTAPLDPDRFEKARRAAGQDAVSPPVTRKNPRKPKPGQTPDAQEPRASSARRKRLFNPDWKAEEK